MLTFDKVYLPEYLSISYGDAIFGTLEIPEIANQKS